MRLGRRLVVPKAALLRLLNDSTASAASYRERRTIPTEVERIRAANRTRMRRFRALRRQGSEGGDAA